MFLLTLRRTLLKMPQHKWDGTVRTVRTKGFFTLAAIAATAMATQASLLAVAQDAPGSEPIQRAISIGMKALLMLGIIAVGTIVLAFEILGLRREHLKK